MATRVNHSQDRFEVKSAGLGKQRGPELQHSPQANRRSFNTGFPQLYLTTQTPAHSQGWPPAQAEQMAREGLGGTQTIQVQQD